MYMLELATSANGVSLAIVYVKDSWNFVYTTLTNMAAVSISECVE